MEHHLERIVVAEKILVASGDALGLGHVSRVYRAGDLARDAGRRTVQALVVLFEKVPVYARVVVEAVDVGERDELHEIAVAGEVLRVQAQVEAPLVLVARRVVARRGDVRLAAEDRLHADRRQLAVRLLLLGTALVVEILERVQVPVVGDGERPHAKRAGALDERHDLALPV